MNIAAIWDWARTQVSTCRAPLRFCLRMTVAALLSFALAQVLTVPLHGLWAVLTAVVVTQTSVGGSLRATSEYVIGTLGGAIYASAVGVLVPHTTELAMAGVLALAVAPLAYAAMINPRFRVAPFTAVTVLLISSQLGEGPIVSALYRLLEVMLGGAVAVTVSLLVFPERAYGLGLDAAARILDQMAQVLPELLAGFTRKIDIAELRRIQDETGRAVTAFQAIAAEAKRERMVNFGAEPDTGPLSRTLLRLRHDFVIIGRAGAVPLPTSIAECLGPPLTQIGVSASDYLHSSAGALASRRPPPSIKPVEAALEAFSLEISALRSEGLTRTLSSAEVEHLFALGFALEQLHQNFCDLERCIQDWVRPSRSDRSRQAGMAAVPPTTDRTLGTS